MNMLAPKTKAANAKEVKTGSYESMYPSITNFFGITDSNSLLFGRI